MMGSGLLLLLALYPFVLSGVLGPPFQYVNDTFPVCMPDQNYLHDDECIKPDANFTFHSRQLVPMLVQKCYSNPFDRQDTVAYLIHRRLVSDQNGVAITLGDTFATIARGCQTLRQSIHAIPPETPSGIYHFEGFSEIHVWRNESVPWRSVSFPVSSVPLGET